MSEIGSPIQVYVSLIFLIVAVVMDLRSDRIANLWICVGISVGIFLFLWGRWGPDARSFLMGILIPIMIGWVPFRMRAIGAGDIKVFLVIGCLNGGSDVFYCIFLSFLFAAGFSFSKLLSQRQLRKSLSASMNYFLNIITEKKIKAYPGRFEEIHTIHFSVSILFGYAAWLGVSACKIVSLF